MNNSSNKLEEKIIQMLEIKRGRENGEFKSKKYKEENKNRKIYIKKEKYCSKNIDDA